MELRASARAWPLAIRGVPTQTGSAGTVGLALEVASRHLYDLSSGAARDQMSRAADAPIRIENGEVTVDAGFLATRLGLAVEKLQAEMRRGAVVSTVEEGRDEDARRTRITVRYGARLWRAVVGPDGTIVEAPPPGAKPPDAGGPDA